MCSLNTLNSEAGRGSVGTSEYPCEPASDLGDEGCEVGDGGWESIFLQSWCEDGGKKSYTCLLFRIHRIAKGAIKQGGGEVGGVWNELDTVWWSEECRFDDGVRRNDSLDFGSIEPTQGQFRDTLW